MHGGASSDGDNGASSVLTGLVGPVSVITLNRPAKRNAQDPDLLRRLDAAWMAAAADPEVRVIVLRAEGKHFSAGHDLSPEGAAAWFAEVDLPGRGLSGLYDWEAQNYLDTALRWRNVPKPSIAAVQGSCIGGGLMLCWPCDLIVAADDARFADPTVIMGTGGVELHAHTWELGPRKAKELLLTAGALDAAGAERLGMVNRVVPRAELDATVMALAAEIAQRPPFALRQAKRAVNQTLDVRGFTAAVRAAFDIHQTGHGHALSVSGGTSPTLVADVARLREGQR